MEQFRRNIIEFPGNSDPIMTVETNTRPSDDGNRNNNINKLNNNNNMKNNPKVQLQFHELANAAYVPFENEAVQYWKVFFDFAYYTLLSPFRFIWDQETGLYICHTSPVQRTMQWILSISTTIYFLLKVLQMTKLDPEEHPTLYFDLAYYFFDTTFLVTLFLCFGTQKPLVDSVFRELQENNRTFYLNATNYRKTRRICTIICIACLGTLVLQVFETLLDQDWDFGAFVQFWEDDAAEVFHHHGLTKTFPFAFGCLALTGSLFEKLLNAFSDILFTMTVLMFDTLVNSYEADMRNERGYPDTLVGSKVIEHYWWLKYITAKINHAMNLIIGAFVVGNLPFYATNVFEVFGDGNIFMRLRFMCYCSYWFPSLFLAANANHKVESVKTWIVKEKNFAKVPPKKLMVFLHEVDDFTIGMCSYGVLTVTWALVGNIISVILTYALLKSQFKTAVPVTDTGLDDPFKDMERNLTMMANATMIFSEA